MPTLSRCIGTKVSRVRASSDRVGRPLGWTGLIITPLQRKPGLALLFRQLTIGSAPSLRAPGILRTPLPIRPRSLRFYLTPIKCTCTLQFGNFSTICGKRLTKLPRMLLPAGNPQPLLFRRTTESMSAACGVSMLARLLLRPQERLLAATAPRLPALKIVCHY